MSEYTYKVKLNGAPVNEEGLSQWVKQCSPNLVKRWEDAMFIARCINRGETWTPGPEFLGWGMSMSPRIVISREAIEPFNYLMDLRERGSNGDTFAAAEFCKRMATLNLPAPEDVM